MNANGPASSRRPLWNIVKVLAALGCVAFVVTRIDPRRVLSALVGLGGFVIAALVLLAGCHLAVLALRWRAALRYLGEDVPLRSLAGDLLVGAAYNTILPSTVGGDIARAWRCATRVLHPPAVLASIALERVIGLLCLSLIPLVGLLLDQRRAPGVFLGVALVGTALFGSLMAFLHVPLELLARLVGSIAPRAGAFVSGTARDLRAVYARPRLAIAGWTVLYHALVMSSLLIVAGTFHEPATTRAVLIGVPIAMVLSTLPITIGGLGLRESMFVAVLGPLGLTGSEALVLAFVWGTEWLLLAGAGALVLAITRLPRPERSALAQSNP